MIATMVTGLSGTGKTTYCKRHRKHHIIHVDLFHDYGTNITDMSSFAKMYKKKESFTFEGYHLPSDYNLLAIRQHVPDHDLELLVIYTDIDTHLAVSIARGEAYKTNITDIKLGMKYIHGWAIDNKDIFSEINYKKRIDNEYVNGSTEEYKDMYTV